MRAGARAKADTRSALERSCFDFGCMTTPLFDSFGIWTSAAPGARFPKQLMLGRLS